MQVQTSPCELVSGTYQDLVETMNHLRPSEYAELVKQLEDVAARATFMASYMRERGIAQDHKQSLATANRAHRVVRSVLGHQLTAMVTF